MKNQLKIFYVSAEVFPFAPGGRLADVSGAYPKYVKNLGHDIRVMMPNYKSVNERKYVLRDVIRLKGLKIKLGQQTYQANGKSAFIPDSKVQIYFLDNKDFFGQDDFEKTVNGQAVGEMAERFLFFSIGCLETLKLLYWQPDIIHCNDWQTALVPLFLKTVYADDAFFKNTRTLLTVHDIVDSGRVDKGVIGRTGVPEDALSRTASAANGSLDLLQVGIEHADMVITTPDLQETNIYKSMVADTELENVLKKRRNAIHHVADGIDGAIWDPSRDKLLVQAFSGSNPGGKIENKQHFLQRIDLPFDASRMLVGACFDEPENYGHESLLDTVKQLLSLDIQLVLCGNFSNALLAELQTLAGTHPTQLHVTSRPDNRFRHLLFAACDVFLMFDQQTANPLDHFYSRTYGAIPVAAQNFAAMLGIRNLGTEIPAGNGYVLDGVTANAEFARTISELLQLYQDKAAWQKLMKQVMASDFSWKTPVQQYVKLYQKLAGTKAIKT